MIGGRKFWENIGTTFRKSNPQKMKNPQFLRVFFDLLRFLIGAQRFCFFLHLRTFLPVFLRGAAIFFVHNDSFDG
jgi:hypothetical protein